MAQPYTDGLNQCAACTKHYPFYAVMSDPDLCDSCAYFMHSTEPKTSRESDYYHGLERVQDLQPQQHEQTLPGARHYQAYPMPSNPPSQSPAAWPASQNESMSALQAGAAPAINQPQPYTYGYMPYNGLHGHIAQQQATEAQKRYQYFLSKGYDAAKLLPVGRQPAHTGHEQMERRASAAPSMIPLLAEGEEEIPVAAASKKRGKRLICVTCGKDAPVTKDNDGVNCTKCYKKHVKEQQRVFGKQ